MSAGAMLTEDETRRKCEVLSLGQKTPDRQVQLYNQCLCVLGAGQNRTESDCHQTNASLQRLSAAATDSRTTGLFTANMLTLDNSTETPPPSSDQSVNLINSDVFIYVIVFIVVVYFLTFLYLCLKKRRRDAADAETGRAAVNLQGQRSIDSDRPPAYDDVVPDADDGDKNVPPPSYDEVLARSQELNKPDLATPNSDAT